MTSQVDNFIISASAAADPVLGTDTLTVSTGVVLTGVWSVVTTSNMVDDGGFMVEADASIIISLDANVTKALVGKTATGKGESFRIVSVDVGEALGTVYLRKDTAIL